MTHKLLSLGKMTSNIMLKKKKINEHALKLIVAKSHSNNIT